MAVSSRVAACVLVVLCLSAHTTNAAYCHGSPSPNAQPNTIPIYTEAPVLVATHTNGKLYSMANITQILHVWGSPYEMGIAQGTLLKAELNIFMPTLWEYILSQVGSVLTKVPAWLAKIIETAGIDAALDLTYEATKDYTGAYFYEEMQGLSDASGVDFKMLRRIHLIGELTKGACSMYGAWDTATSSTGHLFQLRALDWDTEGPYKDYPLITVYHPNSTNGHAFLNVGFAGWIGSMTGASSEQMAISEIGVSFPDSTFGEESRVGIPFTYLLRDILQFDKTLDNAIDRITTAKRTCDLILGVGDGKLGYFRGFQYSSSVANVIDPLNLLPANDTWHPQIKDVVYWGMDWLCPGYNQKLSQQLTMYHGNITGENTIQYITSIVQTGNLHIAISDLTSMELWASFARKTGGTGNQYAYERQFVHLDMTQLWNEPAPTL